MLYNISMSHRALKIWSVIILLGMASIPFIFVYVRNAQTPLEPIANEVVITSIVSTPLNATYLFSGESIPLTDGVFTRSIAPESATVETFRVFGEPTYADLDGDGDEDAILLLTQDGGGSGTFYYVAIAVRNDDMYTGTNAMLLGDRIAPQNINIQNGVAVVNYVTRNQDDDFTTSPSVGKSIWIHFDAEKNEIGEAVKDFEGEVNPEQMTLTMHPWRWVKSDYEAVSSKPTKPEAFSLTFLDDGTVRITTDCNTMSGQYTTDKNTLVLSQLISTLMYCEDSQENEFSGMLSKTTSYSFSTKGELLLHFDESNIATFVGI